MAALATSLQLASASRQPRLPTAYSPTRSFCEQPIGFTQLAMRVFIYVFLLFSVSPVFAQSDAYPTRPVRIVVPFTPGSVTDIMARSVSDRLAAAFGQPVVVENRPGAGGTIGTGVVAKSAADGYTLAVVSAGYAFTPAIYDQLPYDPGKDLAGVSPLANLPSVLFVSSTLGVTSAQELVGLARAKPGALNYASAGIGSASHVSAEKVRAATGLDVVHVPLKGAPEMVAETLAGRTHFGLVGITAVLPALRDRRSEEHTSELQSRLHLVCRLLLEKKKKKKKKNP